MVGLIRRVGGVVPFYVLFSLVLLMDTRLGVFPSIVTAPLGFFFAVFVPGHVFLALAMPGIIPQSNAIESDRPNLHLILIPVTSIMIVSFVGLLLSIVGQFSEENIVISIFLISNSGIFFTMYFRENGLYYFESIAHSFLGKFGANPLNFERGVNVSSLLLFASVVLFGATLIEK